MINKGEKNTIWIYAVILFSCAFMILLLTFYSQEKLQNSTKQLNTKITNVSKTNEQTVINLKTARDQNKILQNQMNELQKQLDEEKVKSSELETSYKAQIDTLSKKQSTNSGIGKAVIFYLNKDLVKCAESIANIDKSTLTDVDKELYDILSSKSFYTASHFYYSKGYNSYTKKQYVNAVEYFKKTLSLSGDFYFSDDSYMFLAYSYYYLSDKENAKATYESLVVKYPNSELSASANEFYKLIQ
jgi:tetratricopeptide (TPR) repeat protein